MLLIGKGRFSKVFQAVFNYIADLFISFSWRLYPFQVHGEGAGAYPSCWWGKAGYASDWLTCSLQYCVSNCLFSNLLKGTSALPRRCSGTFPYQNTFRVFASTGVWTEYPPILFSAQPSTGGANTARLTVLWWDQTNSGLFVHDFVMAVTFPA